MARSSYSGVSQLQAVLEGLTMKKRVARWIDELPTLVWMWLPEMMVEWAERNLG